MAARKPRYSHRSVLRLEPSRRQATVGYSILTLLATIALVSLLSYRAGHWPDRWPPEEPVQSGKVITAAWIVAAVLGLFLVAAVRNGRRWRIGNAVVRLSTTPTGQALLPDKRVTTSPSRRASSIPYLEVAPVVARRLPRPRPLGQVDVTHNVTGRPPLRIGYLRIFENNARAKTFMHGAWREFGWVYLLRSATAVPPAEYREIVRAGGKAFIDSPEAFEAEVQRQRQAPVGRGLHLLRNVSPYVIGAWDRFGAYPPVAPLCHGAYWRAAVDELLLRVDAVLIDLSGYREANEGTGFEIQRVVDRFPIERAVFLSDPRSDRQFVTGQIHDAWSRMAAGSPNARGSKRTTVLAAVDQFRVTTTRDSSGNQTTRTDLVARKSETRKLAAWLEEVAAVAPEPPRDPWTNEETAADVTDDSHLSLGVPALAGPPPRASGLRLGMVLISLLVAAALGLAVYAVPWLASDRASLATPDAGPTALTPSTTLTGPDVGTSPTVVEVPDVFKQSPKDAKGLLEALGLRVGDRVPKDSSFGADTVLGTRPKAGTIRRKGDTVHLVVATGFNVVPRVVDESMKEAQDAVREAGFEPRVTDQESDTVQALVVIDQDPRTGESAKLGSVVNLTVTVAPTSKTATPTPTATPESPTPTPTDTPESPTPTPSTLPPSDGSAELRAP